MLERSITTLTPEDFNASKVGDEIYGVDASMALTAVGYALGSILRNPSFSYPHIDAIDNHILSHFGDHRSHSASSWLTRTSLLRNDTRSMMACLIREKDILAISSAISWATNPPAKEAQQYVQATLNHLRSDTTQSLAHLLQKESDRTLSANILSALSRTVFQESGASPNAFATSPDGIEIKWILASHPDTPSEILSKFAPTDLQWLSILSHPNTDPPLLFRVITSALQSRASGAMDGGNVSAALAHGWWTTERLRQLYKDTHPFLRTSLMPDLLNHPACPVEYLEQSYPDLTQPSLIRLASLSNDSQILEGLAFHADRVVREATKLNPRTPEHAKVAAALGNLQG